MSQVEENSYLLPGARFILASASPRRAEILANVGWRFAVRVADVDETPHAGEAPQAYVERLAFDKAIAVVSDIDDDAERMKDEGRLFVLGADTVVVLDGAVMGKPVDLTEAKIMLRRLSGRTHEVVTGVGLIDAASGAVRVTNERTRVRFADLSDAEIEAYVATGEPLDKAGAYAVQGRGSLFIEGIEGDYWNVVGLPVRVVYRLVKGLMEGEN